MNAHDLHTVDDFSIYMRACSDARLWTDGSSADADITQLAIRCLKADPEVWTAVVVQAAYAHGTLNTEEAADQLAGHMEYAAGDHFWRLLAAALVAEVGY